MRCRFLALRGQMLCRKTCRLLRASSTGRRNSGQTSARTLNRYAAIDPTVWSGRASQVDFAELAVSGLASMYPAFDWSVVLLAIMDISARASSLCDRPRPGKLGHQCSHAPGRPNLHFVSSSRRPRRVKCIDLATSSRAPHFARPL